MRIVELDEIKAALSSVDLLPAIEHGFVEYSKGNSVVPPVGELCFDDPPGDVHIKYGYIRGDDYYVIKIASGFYDNHELGLPTGDGMMLMFEQKTGRAVAAMVDKAYLTDIRTAVAGAICAKYLAPKSIERIGIMGLGVQGHLQLEHLSPVIECRRVLAWGRDPTKLDGYATDMTAHGFAVETTQDADELVARCNLIVTTTPATEPIISGGVRPGTTIIAMGSDTHDKQEVSADVLAAADVIVADSIPQCLERGEIHQAVKAGAIDDSGLVELGSVIAGDAAGRTSEDQLIVADLTGVAVQDIQITKAVYDALN